MRDMDSKCNGCTKYIYCATFSYFNRSDCIGYEETEQYALERIAIEVLEEEQQ